MFLRSPFLWTGNMKACFHAHGNFPDARDRRNRCKRGTCNTNEQRFSSVEGIPSGPGELECFSLVTAAEMASSSISIEARERSQRGTLSAADRASSSVTGSLEKTLANFLANSLQISSVLSASSSARCKDDGSPDSLRFSSTSFQNFLGLDFNSRCFRRW